MDTSLLICRNAGLLNNTPFSTVNIAVLTPIPRVSTSTVTNTNPAFRRHCRNANRRSLIRPITASPVGSHPEYLQPAVHTRAALTPWYPNAVGVGPHGRLSETQQRCSDSNTSIGIRKNQNPSA